MANTSAVAGAVKAIAAALITEAKYLYGVEDQVEALRSNLEYMQEFIQKVDANPYLLKQDGQLRILTRQMRELAFRAEDAIDTFLVDIRSITYNKNFLLKCMCLASHSYPVHMLIKEVDSIQKDLEDAMSRSEKFRSAMSVSTTSQSQVVSVGSTSGKPIAEHYLHLDDEFVVGIEDDVARLVQRLTDPEDDFVVLGIVGTGGGGKTTLASQIYRHDKIQRSFLHRAFISISQKWSRSDLLHRVSNDILGNPNNFSSETELIRELHDFMKGKQCLIVLDDIWKKEAWDDIYPIFPHTKGFRVVLTTRNVEIPLHANKKCILHEPQMLTNDEMWALFSKGAVEGRHIIENNIEFEKLGKLMLQKCHGLPLAVVTLAGILRTKEHLYEWERVNVACKDNILKGKGGFTYGVVEDMLELSYLELPTRLKPLFLSLAMIPEDADFSSKQLTRMWIAEGFVTDDQELRCETLEDEAMWFLDELAQRFIFQVTERNSRDHIKSLRLHDLMKEFCTKKATECQFLEYVTSTISHERRANKPRRVSIFSREYSLAENSYIRSIVYHSGMRWSSHTEGVIRKLGSIHKEFKLLRVLCIYGCLNDSLPKEIGNLIHLTSLVLENTQITELPDSIRNLRNLIYFTFYTPRGKVLLPDNLVRNMENLRVFEFPVTLLKRGSIKCNNTLGLSSERHKKLHTLSCGVGKWMKKDLVSSAFPAMRELFFYNVEKVEEMKAIHQWLSLFKANLNAFSCVYGNTNDAFNQEHRFDIEKLKDFQSLHTLYLGCPLLVKSLSIDFPPNLVTLILGESRITEEVDLMEVLGRLSKLKYLTLLINAYLGNKLSCGGAAFPQLQTLCLDRLGVEEWRVEGRALDSLKKIEIIKCPRLKRLPERIASITTLKELCISVMSEEFCRRLGFRTSIEDEESTIAAGFGQDSYLIQHIPSVKFAAIGRGQLLLSYAQPVPEKDDQTSESSPRLSFRKVRDCQDAGLPNV